MLKQPHTNKEANLKYNTNPNNYSTIERLYTQDIKKREEKKQILKKIYTPSFKPTLYTNKQNLSKTLQQNNNHEEIHPKYDEKEKEDDDEEEAYKSRGKRFRRHDANDEDEEEKNENEYNGTNNKKKKKERKNLSVKKKKIKMKLLDDDENGDESVDKGKKKKLKKNNANNNKGNDIENKLRDLLFKNKRPIGASRNRSAERRKKVAFTIS